MKTQNIFDMHECFRCPSWRRLFEQPQQLQRWIYFHLCAVLGRRSKEMALLSCHFARTFSRMARTNGPLWTAKYMKVSKLFLYKALGGRDLSNTSLRFPCDYKPSSKMVPVSLARSGLPRIILKRHRSMILRGRDSAKWIRLYATLFDLHKLILIPVVADVESIVAPTTCKLVTSIGPVTNPAPWLDCLNPKWRTIPLELGYGSKIMWTSGPNTPPGLGSLAMVAEDAQALLLKLIPMELRFLDIFFCPSLRFPGTGDRLEQEACKPRGSIPPAFMSYLLQTVAGRPTSTPLRVGKVGRKVEPAGKTRLFMIMDGITQRLLQPLHEWVFTILKLIPQDGTFAQRSPIHLLVAKGVKALYSFDLRSATDRVPAEACELLLERIWGDQVAIAWRALLYREFHVPQSRWIKQPLSSVLLTTGTPLGSLSSWGIFALFHHLLVQHAAYIVGRKRAWFQKYAILGDDLVIGHARVAKEYKRLLKLYGVDISLEKSLKSVNGSMEFASRFIWKGIDLSPVSFRLLVAAKASTSQLPSFFDRVSEYRQVRLSEFFRIKGAGYRVLGSVGLGYTHVSKLPKRWFRLWLLIHHPRSPRGLPWLWWLSCGRKGLIPPEALGVLHDELLQQWYASLDDQGWVLDPSVHARLDQVPYSEETVYRPWVHGYLTQLSRVARRVIDGEILDPLLDWVVMKRDLNRLPHHRGTSLSIRKWSRLFRLYDRMSRILAQQLPLTLLP